MSGPAGTPVSGWYPDPSGRQKYRWWDGARWTAYAGDDDVRWDEAPVEPEREVETGMPGLGAAAVGFVGGGVVGLVIALALRDAGYPLGRAFALATSELGLWSGLIGACIYVSRRQGTGSLVRDFHWKFRWSDIGVGFAGSIAGRVVSAAVIAPIPMPFPHVQNPDRSLFGRVTTGAWSWAVVAVIVCVGAPLVEELFFRGLVQPRLVTLLGPVRGIVLASIVFGAAHLIAWQGPITLAYALAVAGAGLVLGTLRHLSGRLGPGTAAHALFNGEALLAVALLT
ncbi:MAG: CPBP family intramembrane metalloprotease [Acidimicrobiia bacterium]|nr:CPBP family intramembrane metalloprotease [Acidimicrobiia bacterium]